MGHTARDYIRAWHSECNAYCRDGHHAGIVYCDGGPDVVARQMMRFVEDQIGGRYVAHQPAPEAPVAPRRVTVCSSGRVEKAAPMETPYLLIWEAA